MGRLADVPVYQPRRHPRDWRRFALLFAAACSLLRSSTGCGAIGPAQSKGSSMTMFDSLRRAAMFMTAAAVLGGSPAFGQTAIRFSLDSKIEGPAAPFLVAIDKGYFKAEGL